MSNRNEVAIIYKQVIEDVLRKVRRDFVNMGVDEQVLQELQTGWEERLMASGIFNVRPTGAMNPVPIALQPIPSAVGIGSGMPMYAPLPAMIPGQPTVTPPQLGYVAPGSAMSAFVTSAQHPHQQQSIGSTNNSSPSDIAINLSTTASGSKNISSSTTSNRREKPIDSDPDALNSDLDSTDSELDGNLAPDVNNGNNNRGEGGDDDQQQQQPDPNENFLLCLYEKVHRTRNKWRCIFQNGILHVDGQEYVLGKINGEFEW